MGNLKNRIKKYYEKSSYKFISFIEDISKIKEIGIKSLWEKNKIIVTTIVLSIILIFIVFFSSLSLSEEKVLDKFQLALINRNPSMLSHYVKVENQSVSAKELQPLIDEYATDEIRIKKIVNEIRTNRSSGNFTLKSTKGFFKEKYYIDINNVTVDFITNISNVYVEFGDKKFNLLDKAEFKVVPGSYSFKYTYNTKYGNITDSKTIDLVENNTIEINVDGNYITLYSNFDDAKVFINDVDTGLIAKDIKNYGPLPKDKDIKIYLKKEFPWGSINSKEVLVNNEQYLKLDINLVNDELTNMIDEVVNSFYSSSFEALNNEDKSLILGATNKVKDTVYNYINEKSFLLSNNYEITDLSVEIEKSDFKYENDKYKASVVTKVNYSVYKKLLPFVKNINESYFILSLEYKDETFIINEIQKVDI